MREKAATKLDNKEAEVALIGSVLYNPDQLPELMDVVSPDDFSWQDYGDAWQAILDINEKGLGVDVITLGDHLEKQKKLNEFALDGEDGSAIFHGRAALSRIHAAGTLNGLSYAHTIAERAAERKVLAVLNNGAGWIHSGRPIDSVISDMTKMLGEVRTFNPKGHIHEMTLTQALLKASDMTDQASQGKVTLVPTGLPDLDYILGGGMGKQDMIILAARPGEGKSALLATIASNAAKFHKKKVAIISLEMANEQIAMRLIAMETGIPTDRQRRGKLSSDEWVKRDMALTNLSKMNIFLNDTPSLRIAQIRQYLRKIGEIDLLIIDYIQLAEADGKYDNRTTEVSAISRGLKLIAKEFNIPVLAAAQLSRAVEQRATKRPQLSDLRESGAIEQDADVVLFIYEKKELMVAKHRNGMTGSVDIIFFPERTRFENAAK